MILPLILAQDDAQHLLPLAAGESPQQDYETIEAATVHRMASGLLVKQRRWSRLRTTLSASGWQPDAWAGLDWSRPLDIWCVSPLALDGAGRVFTLPAARRSDAAPVGLALVGRDLRRTPIDLVDDVVTLTEVAGASRYRVLYWPVLTVYATPPRRSGAPHEARYGWEIVAEEV